VGGEGHGHPGGVDGEVGRRQVGEAGVSDRRLAVGDTAGSLTLFGAVRSHPPKFALVDQLDDRTLTRWALSAEDAAVGLACGAGLDLEALVASVLADLSLAT
jgi:hypothetical protein